MSEHKQTLDGSAQARVLPNGAINALGFFISAKPSAESVDAPITGNGLDLRYSPLDPRAWSVLLAYRIAHSRGIVAHIEKRQASTLPGISGILPDVRVLDDEGHLCDDWRNLSRSIIRWSNADVALYPEQLREQIDELDDIIDRDLIDGLFSIVYASAQQFQQPRGLNKRDFLHGAQTHAALRRVFYARLGWLDDILSRSRYLLGEQLTDADLHLFGVLLTFDIGYRSAFPAPDAAIVDYPHLWDFARRIYRTEGLVTEQESQLIGLVPDENGTYQQPWGTPAFTETVDSIVRAWNA